MQVVSERWSGEGCGERAVGKGERAVWRGLWKEGRELWRTLMWDGKSKETVERGDGWGCWSVLVDRFWTGS